MGTHSMLSSAAATSEGLVADLLVQIILILVFTTVVVAIARRFGQTNVSGEILAGVLLGPSLLGVVAPELLDRLLEPTTSTALSGMAQLGLVLLMFQVGLEFDFKSVLRARKRAVATVSIAGIVVPFLLGYMSGPFFHSHLPEAMRPELGPFRFFFAVALSITALPVLARIYMELDLGHTPLAGLVIGAASIDDIAGWLLLGIVSLTVSGHFAPAWLMWHVAGLILYLAFVATVVRPVLSRYLRRAIERHEGLDSRTITVVLVAVFASALATSHLDVFAVIGGFVLGVALHGDRGFTHEWSRRVAPLVSALLVPLFFVSTGLRTDIGSLSSWSEVGMCLLVIAIAFGGKLSGGYLAMRSLGGDRHESAAVAVSMNTRGLMELVAINVGYELGVLPPSMYTKLVLLALVSTFVATPLIKRLTRSLRTDHTPPAIALGEPAPYVAV